jgi:DNA-binding GntR family transcriptional regulator
MLQSEGFIRSVPNQRVRVSEVSVADLEQLYTMRLTLEAVAIRLSVPQLTEGDIGDLHELLTTMESYRAARNVEAWHAPHREFHRRLIAYAGDAITEVVASLQDKADRYRHIYITSEPLAWSATGSEHEAIVAACERRDASAAGDLLARHLARTALTLVALMDPHHEPVPIRTVLSLMVESATPEAVTTRAKGVPVASTGAGSTSGGPENGGGAE